MGADNALSGWLVKSYMEDRQSGISCQVEDFRGAPVQPESDVRRPDGRRTSSHSTQSMFNQLNGSYLPLCIILCGVADKTARVAGTTTRTDSGVIPPQQVVPAGAMGPVAGDAGNDGIIIKCHSAFY